MSNFTFFAKNALKSLFLNLFSNLKTLIVLFFILHNIIYFVSDNNQNVFFKWQKNYYLIISFKNIYFDYYQGKIRNILIRTFTNIILIQNFMLIPTIPMEKNVLNFIQYILSYKQFLVWSTNRIIIKTGLTGTFLTGTFLKGVLIPNHLGSSPGLIGKILRYFYTYFYEPFLYIHDP